MLEAPEAASVESVDSGPPRAIRQLGEVLAAAGTTELAALETVDCWELLASLVNALADEAAREQGSAPRPGCSVRCGTVGREPAATAGHHFLRKMKALAGQR